MAGAFTWTPSTSTALKLLLFYTPSLVKDHERFWSLRCFSLLCHGSVLLLKAVSATLWCTWFCPRMWDDRICFRMCLPRVCVNCDKPQAQTRHRAPYSSAELSVPGAQSKSDITLAATKSTYKKKKKRHKYVKNKCPLCQWKHFLYIFPMGRDLWIWSVAVPFSCKAQNASSFSYLSF